MVWKVLEGGGISLHKEQPACTDYLSAITSGGTFIKKLPRLYQQKMGSMDGHARSTHGLCS